MKYKKLDQKQGWDYLSKVQNVFLFQDDEAFVNSFENRKFRFRCLFHERELIYLYLTLDEIERNTVLNPTPEGIYFYGAYNDGAVRQMRAFCEIKQVQVTKEYNSIFRSIRNRLLGEKIDYDNFIKNLIFPDELDKDRALKSLGDKGRLYRFTPLSFACSERN